MRTPDAVAVEYEQQRLTYGELNRRANQLGHELRERGIDIVARAQYERVGSQVLRSGPDGEILVWQRPNKPRGMKGEQYRTYPETLLIPDCVDP